MSSPSNVLKILILGIMLRDKYQNYPRIETFLCAGTHSFYAFIMDQLGSIRCVKLNSVCQQFIKKNYTQILHENFLGAMQTLSFYNLRKPRSQFLVKFENFLFNFVFFCSGECNTTGYRAKSYR